MNYFALNLLLAIVWLFLSGSFTTVNLLFGFAVGYAALAMASPYLGSGLYVRSVVGAVHFVLRYGKEIFVANIQLARDLLRPQLPFVPGIIRYETSGLSQPEVVALANMISLTPGTLSMDTDETGTVLYVHSVYAHDIDSLLDSFRRLEGLIEAVKHPDEAAERRRRG